MLTIQLTEPFVDELDNCGRSKGFIVVKINALADDEVVGYLKMAYIPQSEWDKRFKDNILWFARCWTGWCFDYETLRGFKSYCYPYGHKDEITREEAENKAWEHHKNYYRSCMRYHIDKPMVDYIKVEEEYRRNGIGTSLYLAGAKWCQENGMILHASCTQSYEAKAAWKHLENLDGCIVDQYTCYYRNNRCIRRTLSV